MRYLDHAGRRIRRYADAKRRLAALLEEERRAIVNRAVTRGLDPAAPLKPSGVEWFGDVPAHWEVRRLKGLVANAIEQTNERQEYEIYLALEHVESWTGKYASAGPVQWFSVQTSDLPTMWANPREIEQFDIRKGDLLVCEGGEGGRCGIVWTDLDGYIIQNALHRIRSKDQSLNQYLQYVLSVAKARGWLDVLNDKATIAHFTREKLSAFPLPLPPLPEQRAIVAYLDEATARIDAAITRARRQAELAEEYRDRLTADVVTGQLDVREAAAQLPAEADEEAVDDGAPLGDEAGRREP